MFRLISAAVGGFGLILTGVAFAEPPPGKGKDKTVSKTVFVTSGVYDGDLTPDPNNCGTGIAGADCICQWHADQAELGKPFRAWLSTDSTSPATDDTFTKSDGPYVRIDGIMVAAKWADLTDGTLLSAIEVDENGDHVAVIQPEGYVGRDAPNLVFTGTAVDGNVRPNSPENCSDWTSRIGAAPGGQLYKINNEWTFDTAPIGCGGDHRLYCFEQEQVD